MSAVFPLRALLAAGAMALGGTAYYLAMNVWPFLFENSAWALAILGVALAISMLAPPHGSVRTLFNTFAMLVALAAAAWAAVDLWSMAQIAWGAAQGAQAPLLALQTSLTSHPPQILRAATAAAIIVIIPLTIVAVEIRELFRVDPNNRVLKTGPWRAQWMSKADTDFLKSNKVGIPLGLVDGSLLRFEPAPGKGWRGGHHVVLAGTRAGKGVSTVLPAILDHEGPVVVLDVKGENFAVTRRYRKALGRKVVALNPFSVVEPSRHGFNPLDYVRRGDMVRDIEVIADGLIRPEPGAGAHFSSMAQNLIAAAIEVVLNHETADGRNLNAVADLLLAGNIETTLQAWIDNEAIVGRRPAQAAAAVLAAGTNERGGIMTTVKKAFDWARSDEMRAFLTRSDFDLNDLLDDKLDLFIVVPLDQIEAQAVFLRLLVNIALGTVVRQDGNRKAKKRILLVLDEFVRLGRMEKLLTIANVAAGAGIEAMFITQDLGQIQAAYGKADASSLLGSCTTTRIFGLGRSQFETAQWASNALGDQTILTRQSTADATGKTSNSSTSEQRQKLMTPDQILEMSQDEMLCLIASKPPLKLGRIISHNHPAYRKKLDPNPTVRA